MAELHVLKVFVGDEGVGGNPLGVFLEGSEIPEDERQRVAADLGFSETVFVEDAETGELRIFTPKIELPFAGHPLVGTAWLLGERANGDRRLAPTGRRSPGEGGRRHRLSSPGHPDWAPEFEHRGVGVSRPGSVAGRTSRGSRPHRRVGLGG